MFWRHIWAREGGLSSGRDGRPCANLATTLIVKTRIGFLPEFASAANHVLMCCMAQLAHPHFRSKQRCEPLAVGTLLHSNPTQGHASLSDRHGRPGEDGMLWRIGERTASDFGRSRLPPSLRVCRLVPASIARLSGQLVGTQGALASAKCGVRPGDLKPPGGLDADHWVYRVPETAVA